MPPARAVGSVFTRPSPTSRGLGRCVSFRMGRGREQTAAGPRAGACRLRGVGRRCLAPVGKGCCRYAGSTLFALRAKALQSGAPDFVVSREKAGFRNVSPIRGLSRRAGGRGNGLLPARGGVFPARRNPYALTMSLSPQETEIRAISPSKHVLPPTKPSTFIHPWQTRPVTSRVSSPPAFRGEHPARAQAQRSTPAKGHLSALPAAASPPTIPPGERRALPAPAQGSRPLRIPFWGAAAVSPHPRPPTPQAASPCSWACRRLLPPPPHSERNEASPPPAHGADLRDPRAEGTGRRHCRPTSLAGACTSNTSSPARRGGWDDRRPACGIPPCAHAASHPAPPG